MFAMPGLSCARADLAAGVGDRALELPADDVRIVVDVDRALLGATGRRHLAFGLLQVADARADRRDARLRHDQQLAEALVEAPRDIAHQLDVLALVLAHRNLVGAVRQHVGRLQDGVHQQPGRDELALGDGLVAELVHPVELADRRHRGQQPAQLGVLLHVALAEQDAALGVETRRHQDRCRVVDALAQRRRVVVDGGRVQVDDAVDRGIRAVLAFDVLPDRPDVIAEMLAPSRLDAGEDHHAGRARIPAGPPPARIRAA